jgi:hypothetical protein
MAPVKLTEGLYVGTILWIKKLAHSEDGESHGLPQDYFMHPCVVLDLPDSTKGFAKIYVVCIACFALKPAMLLLSHRLTARDRSHPDAAATSTTFLSHRRFVATMCQFGPNPSTTSYRVCSCV